MDMQMAGVCRGYFVCDAGRAVEPLRDERRVLDTFVYRLRLVKTKRGNQRHGHTLLFAFLLK